MTLLPRHYARARAAAARAMRAVLRGEDALGWLAVLGVELAADGLSRLAGDVVDAACVARLRRMGCCAMYAEFMP